jgi:arylsulfatase A-like enzyme
VRLVHVNWYRSPDEPADAPCWDSHARETRRLKTVLIPPFDLAFSALLEDLDQRGLLDDTLVVAMAEFGRTPRLNGNAGRDHWGSVFSVALAGAGIRPGVVHGASDRLGAYPAGGVVHPEDLSATLLHLLGHDPETRLSDPQGRVFSLSTGRVIEEILVNDLA